MTISLDEFLNLPTEEVARLVQTSGPKVVVFPFNGTRRWFLLEHGLSSYENPAESYIELTTRAYIEVYKLLFDHGLDTVIAPVFGGDILKRGNDYMEQIGKGMTMLVEHPAFLSFYNTYEVAIHFYGDYQKQLAGTPYAYISELFDRSQKKTSPKRGHRLFYGVFGTDATEAIAEYSVEFHRNFGRIPSRSELITWYYGDILEKADIFIGFEKFSVFDYPLLSLGDECLYFTAAPSLYMTACQLRTILYDYMFLRPVADPDYFDMGTEAFEKMRRYYTSQRETVFGLGEIHGGIWYAAQLKNDS